MDMPTRSHSNYIYWFIHVQICLHIWKVRHIWFSYAYLEIDYRKIYHDPIVWRVNWNKTCLRWVLSANFLFKGQERSHAQCDMHSQFNTSPDNSYVSKFEHHGRHMLSLIVKWLDSCREPTAGPVSRSTEDLEPNWSRKSVCWIGQKAGKETHNTPRPFLVTFCTHFNQQPWEK